MGILLEIGEWRAARRIEKETCIRGPQRRQTFVWTLAGSDEVGVIEKVEGGRFLKFHVERGKTFGKVAGQVKRRYTMERRKGGQQ